MKILVCVKQVYMPGTDNTVNPAYAGVKYNPAGFRLNSYDEYALKEALLIKERIGTTEEHAISVGPGRVEAVIKSAMEMGSGEGIHIRYEKEEQLTPYQVASLIASYAKDKPYAMKKSKPMIHKIGIAAVKTGAIVGNTIIENYQKIDPDVIRHLLQVPLLSYSLFVSRHEKIDPGKLDGHPPLIFVHGLGGNRGNFLLMSWYLWLLGRK